MPDHPPRARATPADTVGELLRTAADLYGAEALARDLQLNNARNLYRWIDGSRSPADPVRLLANVRKLLIARRQAIGDAITALRDAEGLNDEDR